MKYNNIVFSMLLVGVVVIAKAQITANWKATGPIAFPINVSGQINGIGRVCQIKFHPSDATKIYAASASGGLWISENAGVTWHGTGTDNLPSANCASVCVDYANDSILYLGTGDPNYYNTSIGIYKSTDAGASWTASNSGVGNRMAVELLMNPTNPNELIAATNDGIWKSYNAGSSWVVRKSGGAFKDMKFKASLTNSDTLFAVTSSEYYRSIDLGETWTPITAGVFVPGGNGKGMRLAVTKANPEIVYLGMIADEGTILKSSDGGTTFTTVYHNPGQSLVGYDAVTPGQGNYDFGMTADPLNANNVFVIAHCVWRSNDAGITWSKLTSWASDCHTDMHQICYSPYNHSNLFNANDGGIFVSHDDGDTWDPFSDGLEATECYHAAQSPLVTNLISIGTQDNGELYYDNQWKTNRGGDWTQKMMYDYQQPNKVYYFNGDRRVVNGGDQSWNNPFNVDVGTLLFTPLNPNLGFAGLTSIYRSTNLNSGTPTWTSIGNFGSTIKSMAISPVDTNDLYVIVANGSTQIKHSLNALASSPTFSSKAAPSSTANSASIAVLKSNPNILYLSCGSKVYRSIDQGSNWINISYNLPPINIKQLYIDIYSPNESVYICSALGVFYKNDTMNYWANYSQGLPSIADIQDFMITNDSTINSVLRVAYYGRGVWESNLFQPYLMPHAEFAALDTEVCFGENVVFQNNSSINASSWKWYFQGANPSITSVRNPVVNYSTPGIFAVKLVASNALGSDSIIKTSYVIVHDHYLTPLQESFTSSFPPSYWTIQDASNDGVNWMQAPNIGAYGVNTGCLFFDNYNIDAQGRRDGIRTPHYDFSSLSHAQLTFDIAYAPNTPPNLDTLAIYVSSDCDQTFTQVYLKDAFALATAPVSPNVTFIPDSSQWRSETINLDAFVGQNNVSVTFQNRGNAGQELYIDNINISEPLAILNENKVGTIQVYPNPTEGIFTIQLASYRAEVYKIELLNSFGQSMFNKLYTTTIGENKIPINARKISRGIYLLAVFDRNGNIITREKLMID